MNARSVSAVFCAFAIGALAAFCLSAGLSSEALAKEEASAKAGDFAAMAKENGGDVKWFKFDSKDALDEWTEKIFKGKVYYTVVSDEKDGFVRAQSRNSASGLYYKVKFDPKEDPMLSWKWGITKFPPRISSKGTKPGYARDDYAARVYVIFPSLSLRSSRCLEYVWDEEAIKEDILESSWGENVKVIVARNSSKKNVWFREERNVYEDFNRAFGYYPKLNAGAVAFMTDTDDTQGTAEAYYDEIKVGYRMRP